VKGRAATALPGLALAVALAVACAGSTAPPVSPRSPGSPTSPAATTSPAPPASPPVSQPGAPAPQPAVAPPPGSAEALEPSSQDAVPRVPIPPSGTLLVKVGLASDLPSVTLPCCEGAVTVTTGERTVAAVAPITVEPAAGAAERGFWRIQVAALRDEGQAAELARRLSAQTGQAADSHFDAGIDLYRVRVGKYATREAAEEALRALAAVGVTGGWVVSEGARVTQPAMRVTQGATVQVFPGRWLAFESADGTVRALGKRYRGRILVYLNDRGTLNLVDELPLEQYLRGVVPSEMGPEQYPQLEALKAQAVAARTYTLRNLGEFAREGYDICGTPRCQVYGGMAVEHPLTDRAVADTAGQVLLFQGEPVDALYSSTCGGHTEDVAVIFPLKREPYLKGVPCIEAGTARLTGDLPAGQPFPEALTRRLFPPASEALTAEGLAARLEHLALLAGLPAPHGRLTSLDRREVQRFVAAAFDLAMDARLLMAPEDVAYLLQDPPPGWSEEDRRRAAYLLRSGLVTGPLDQPLDAAEAERLLLGLAELVQVVRREEGTFLSLGDGRIAVKAGKEEVVHALPERLATFREQGGETTSAELGLLPGDHVTLFFQGSGSPGSPGSPGPPGYAGSAESQESAGSPPPAAPGTPGALAALAAIVQEVHREGAAYDRTSSWSSWTRFRSDAQLARQVQTRLPGLGFQGFEILSRGVSGRVGKIRVQGDRETVDIEGLAVRWTLDIPDTLFTAKRLEPPGGQPGWLFTGRGWGHGVGMCQVGAYGMAQRGWSYRDILFHYYTGVELGRIRGNRAVSSAPAASRP
jgi:peptidoglycan hydrolase-like amidase